MPAIRRFQNSKHILGICFLIAIFLFSSVIVFGSEEFIDSFNVKADIQEDGVVFITEAITYKFGDNLRHGIFRNIPLTSDKGPRIQIEILEVEDNQGAKYPFTTSISSNVLNIRIGDPNILVSGEKIYVIKYKVSGAIRIFEDHQEFYWNVTGNEWSVPILNSQIDIFLPQPLSSPLMTCYTGPFGSRQQNCNSFSSDNSIRFFINQPLKPKEGFTIVLGFPLGFLSIKETNIKDYSNAKETFPRYPPLFVFIVWAGILFLYLFFLIIKFIVDIAINFIEKQQTFGKKILGLDVGELFIRKPQPVIPWKLRYRSIITEYEPPADLLPIDVGTIFNQRIDPIDISSVIIHLAVRGYLKIKYKQEDALLGTKVKSFEFIKTRDGHDLVHPIDKIIFFWLFGNRERVSLSELELEKSHSLAHHSLLRNIEQEEEAYLKKGGYIRKNSLFIGKLISPVLFFSLLVAILVFIGAQYAVLTFFLFLILLLLFPFPLSPYSLTEKGIDSLAKILGFKEFLEVVEKDRLDFFNAPEVEPEKFEKFLPYAMVLGVEEKWAKKFSSIYTTSPSWYESSDINFKFSSHDLIYSLKSLNRDLSSQFSYGGGGSGSSGFSGFGGSGGGSGGGGGGSW